MAGLLAADHVPAVLHGLEHVAVTDRRLDDGDAFALHGDPEAEVGHDRRHDRSVCQVTTVVERQGEDREDLVAVHHLSRRIDGEAPVGVTVVGDPDVRAVLDHRG